MLIACAQKSPLNVHAGVLSEAKDQSDSPSHHLNPYFENLSSECSGKHEHLHVLSYTFVVWPANSRENIALTKAFSVLPVSSKIANPAYVACNLASPLWNNSLKYVKRCYLTLKFDTLSYICSYTQTIKLCPLDVYVCQFQMYERISFKFSPYKR